MEHKRQIKMLSIIALIVAIAGMSLGFAAFSTTLNISSSASVTPNSDTFIVKFSTSKDSLVTGSVIPSENEYNLNVSNGVINNTSIPTISGLSVTFTEPGQSVSFDVYVRNEGEYTAYLNNITSLGEKTCQGETGTNEELVQSACYDINRAISVEGLGRIDGPITNYPLEPGDSTRLSIIFEYSSMGTRVDGNFSVTFPDVALVYSTIDDPSIEPTLPTKVARLVSGDLNTPGSIVAIGNEQFYVFGKENGNVKLLSMYNLHVGKNLTHYDGDDAVLITIANPTGIQDSSAKGYNYDKDSNEELYPFVGLTVFSNNSSTYSGSIVEGYVNSYKTYLTNMGVEISSARLITKTELEGLGCSSDDYSCSSAPSWIYSTSYWSGTADNDESGVWAVFFGNFFDAPDYNYDLELGIRPVIEISISEFE